MQTAPSHFYKRQSVNGVIEDELVSVSTRLILEAAKEYGVTFREIPDTRVFELNYRGQVKYFHAQIPAGTLEIGFYACLDKAVTKGFLRAAGVSTSAGFNISRTDPKEYWRQIYDAVPKPLVVKPTQANQGRGVHMNISDYESYEKAVTTALAIISDDRAGVIVEETFNGTEYRILATKNKVIGILNRIPANVIGDGHSTIAQLVEIKNQDPRRSDRSDEILIKLKLGETELAHLQFQGLTPESVPAKDERIFLRLNSNISTGGDSIDVTDTAHPSVIEIGIKTMQALPGLEWGGVDFMTKDITQPQTEGSYIIVEVNSSPGFCIHDFPFLGENRHAAREFLFLLYPELEKLPAI
jgi:D-alanine-D-alanine ligase-like ATP-grasp enzyme